MRVIRIGIVQINPIVGDFSANRRKIVRNIREARQYQVDLLAFPELCICGYPPKDLLLKQSFIHECQRSLEMIIAETAGIAVVLGLPVQRNELFNSAALLCDGRLVGFQDKEFLPNYGVFDENRYFQAGSGPQLFDFGSWKLGLSICEDIWHPSGMIRTACLAGAEILVNISASPFHAGKQDVRTHLLCTRAMDNNAYIAYVNQVGGQDDLIFDGQSQIINPDGSVALRSPDFEEILLYTDVDLDAVTRERLKEPLLRSEIAARKVEIHQIRVTKIDDWGEIDTVHPGLIAGKHTNFQAYPTLSTAEYDGQENILANIYKALTVGVRDYIRKNGFTKVVIGLSGGMDSTITAVIAVDALGPENVVGITMPGPYSSRGSITDSRRLARNLGIEFHSISINRIFRNFERKLRPFWGERPGDITEENLQARLRANILMAFSNKFGYMVLTTGNKSETAVGYSTLYGDMAGGLAVIADVPKTLVYQLAEYRNNLRRPSCIPASIFTKPPSAELRPNQLDSDTLPEYPVLDKIIAAYVEEDWNIDEIISILGLDPVLVKRIITMINVNEFKRQQAPVGLRITPRAFGSGRRIPITHRFREEATKEHQDD